MTFKPASRARRTAREAGDSYNLSVPTPAFILTVSDRCFRGEQQDLSGPAVAALLQTHGFHAAGSTTVPDDQPMIEDALREAAAQYPLVLTTGGTGLTPRDVTPEATRAVCTRLLEGLSEHMRAHGRAQTPYSILSRGICGTIGQTLILNLPGAPRGATNSLEAVLPVLQHAANLLTDPKSPHPISASSSKPFTPDADNPVEISKTTADTDA